MSTTGPSNARSSARMVMYCAYGRYGSLPHRPEIFVFVTKLGDSCVKVIVKVLTFTQRVAARMLYDPVSLTVLPPHGDPSPEARFREEYLNRPERKAAKPEAADPRL